MSTRLYMIDGRYVSASDYGKFIADLIAAGWVLTPPASIHAGGVSSERDVIADAIERSYNEDGYLSPEYAAGTVLATLRTHFLSGAWRHAIPDPHTSLHLSNFVSEIVYAMFPWGADD